MSPHRRFENTTCVLGYLALMLAGAPSPFWQGPLFPWSSQDICWAESSFQMLIASTTVRWSVS